MPAPAPLTPEPSTTPTPQGSRSTSTGADINQGRLPSRASLTAQPATPSTKNIPGATPVGATIKQVHVPAPSLARVPAGPAIKLGTTKAANDPRFTNVMDRLEQSAAKAREHPPAAQKSAEAQAASVPPANETVTEAESNKVDTMQGAPTKKPDSESFLALLRAEIANVMPKNLGDTDKFMKDGKKEQLKQAATDNVNQQKNAATAGMKSASDAPPDTSHVQGKQVTPLPKGGGPAAPPAIRAANAVPTPKTDAEISLQKSKQDANASLSNAHVTPQQLQKANNPRFSAVLSAKAAVDKQTDTAPKHYRTDEHTMLTQAATQAVNQEKKGLGALHSAGIQAATTVQGKQLSAKGKDEAARKQVTDHIQGIYDATKKAVDTKLSSLGKEVSDQFDKGVNKALDAMTSSIDDQMNAWKLKRYLSDPLGPFFWARDALLGLPDDVNAFYTQGRQQFTKDLDGVIVKIATQVETCLQEAKDLIAAGQKQISDYVKGLPTNLQAVGQAAEKDIASRFDDMRQEVDDKKNELAQSLAQKYKEASDKADAKIKEMQDANKSLLSTLQDTLGEVVKILTSFRDRIMSLLKQGKEAIDLIVADPIGFLKNLLNAVKQGLMQFFKNIWKHLQAGFLKWLLGPLASVGVTMPPDLSLGSILQLVLQILGLTYERIRAKAVTYIGERNVELIEKAWQLLSILLKGGPAALWEQVKEYLSNLKEMVIDNLQSWLITTVIQVGITKLVAMTNPVGEIITAIITIYDTVTFFIDRINEIMDFVQTIISSVLNIARGNIASAANWIEQALARSVPLIIGFLAKWLGVGGIPKKIASIVQKIQSKVDAALDKLIAKIVNVVKKLLDKLKSAAKKGLGWVKKKLGFGKGKEDKRTDEQKQTDLDEAMAEAQEILEDEKNTPNRVKKLLLPIKSKYNMTVLELVVDSQSDEEETDHIYGEINPEKNGEPVKRTDEQERELLKKELGETTLFSAKDVQRILDLKQTASYDRIKKWLIKGKMFEHDIEHSTGKQYTFDESKKKEKMTDEQERELLKNKFGDERFSRKDIEKVLNITDNTSMDRVNKWLDAGNIYKYSSAARDMYTEYTFKEEKGGIRKNQDEDIRNVYGYNNPDKRTKAGMQILSKGLVPHLCDPPVGAIKGDDQKALEKDLQFHKERARYRSMVPGTDWDGSSKEKVFGYEEAQLGHGKMSAVEHWNTIGYTLARGDIIAWNKDPKNYRGPEHHTESDKEGGRSTDIYKDLSEFPIEELSDYWRDVLKKRSENS